MTNEVVQLALAGGPLQATPRGGVVLLDGPGDAGSSWTSSRLPSASLWRRHLVCRQRVQGHSGPRRVPRVLPSMPAR